MDPSLQHYARQSELLNALSLGGEYFSSEAIITEAARRCRWILAEADDILRRCGYESDLSLQSEKFSASQWIFFARSTPIRFEIERLSKHFPDAGSLHTYAKQTAQRLRAMLPPAEADRAWFGGKKILIETYPFVTIALDPEESADESALVRTYYDDVYGNSFAGGLSFGSFSDAQLHQLVQALGVIKVLNPGMIGDIAANVRHFCLIDVPPSETGERPSVSFSSRYLLGAVFISEQTFSGFGLLLEAIYHESLHLKFFNTILTQKIFLDDRHSQAPQQFECPWIAEGSDHYWHLDRVFAAFHVYLHLHVLYALLIKEVSVSAIPEEWVHQRLSVSDHKGHILMAWLDENLPPRLTIDGQKFYESLRNIFMRSVMLRKMQAVAD